jgi:hypothetical protein
MAQVTREQALVVLGALAAAYPAHPVGADTVELYVRGMTALDDVEALQAAAQEWIAGQDRYPTLHQVLDGYHTHRRRLQEARRYNEQLAAGERGVARALPEAGASYGIEMVDVLRTATEEALAGRQGHQGHTVRGAGTCPVCASADEIAMLVESRVAQLRAERGLRATPDPVVTYRCHECLDRGFSIVRDAGPDITVVPCMACNPEGYERWAGGHLMPGHWCPDCDGGRARGQRTGR